MDLIDRQMLLDALHNRLHHPKNPEQSPGIAAAEKLVKKQPAIQPKRGEWVKHPQFEEEWDVCAACGTGCKRREIFDIGFTEYNYKFCPNCGADMRGEVDAAD